MVWASCPTLGGTAASMRWTNRNNRIRAVVLVWSAMEMYVHSPYVEVGQLGGSVVAVKTKRFELRAEEATLDRIQQAANIVHEQTSEFVRKAAIQRAEDVLRQELVTVMEPEQFDTLMSSLDAADAAPRLAAAARKPAAFTRR